MSNFKNNSSTKFLGGIFLIIGWVIFLSLISILFNNFLFTKKSPEISQTSSGTSVIIYRDNDLHFRVNGKINNTNVTFMIDTGATYTAIPYSIAKKAKLIKERAITTKTANGEGQGYLTTINNLKIGPLEIKNTKAIIANGLDPNTILLGMNIIKYFNLQQKDKQLILTIK